MEALRERLLHGVKRDLSHINVETDEDETEYAECFPNAMIPKMFHGQGPEVLSAKEADKRLSQKVSSDLNRISQLERNKANGVSRPSSKRSRHGKGLDDDD